jgi:hypothetical protein
MSFILLAFMFILGATRAAVDSTMMKINTIQKVTFDENGLRIG